MANCIVDKDGVKRYLVTVNVNGSDFTKVVKANTLLVNFLREELDMIGTKKGCELGDCGCCTVMLDGKAVNACLVLALDVDGREVTTIEGIADGEDLDIVQEKFIEHAAFQCGFCTSGMIVSSRALLNENPSPSEYEVREAIAGNLCRCTGYVNIVEAVLDAAEKK
ncbi:MAG: (2Fe-2S)-binding protein [Pelotomaculaceae bacterium]|jgi:carbon-monoxide dehydrogenase small subunit|uniref:Aerobic-type carbon monoxide dehydrogenase, small subunit CoxS/CutS homologs n=1 Tax=anaerobic digester metagenome TaxID=1263854 RepID=A0A485LX55_9ZZZZ|nr:(2Fe-2S)-binding protein [Bacillota bacterium]